MSKVSQTILEMIWQYVSFDIKCQIVLIFIELDEVYRLPPLIKISLVLDKVSWFITEADIWNIVQHCFLFDCFFECPEFRSICILFPTHLVFLQN